MTTKMMWIVTRRVSSVMSMYTIVDVLGQKLAADKVETVSVDQFGYSTPTGLQVWETSVTNAWMFIKNTEIMGFELYEVAENLKLLRQIQADWEYDPYDCFFDELPNDHSDELFFKLSPTRNLSKRNK